MKQIKPHKFTKARIKKINDFFDSEKYHATEKEIEEVFGKVFVKKMEKTGMLRGITCIIGKDGKIEIPRRDIWIAYKAVFGLPIHPLEWD